MILRRTEVVWLNQDSPLQHIATVGRICYKSNAKKTINETDASIMERNERLANRLWELGHRSMYRHATKYYFIKNCWKSRYLTGLCNSFKHIPYIACVDDMCGNVWISTNLQFILENSKIYHDLEPYSVSEDAFINLAKKYHFNDAFELIRMTFVVTTQISTSRELNRTSPNAIAEQSTRYCNLNKKGGVQIATPNWYADGKWMQRFLYYCGCKVSSAVYRLLLRAGLPPQDARGVLPLDTYTVVAYTYSIHEWRNIINLRFHGTTGKPHPNAVEVVGCIREAISKRMSNHVSNFKI